MTRALSIAADYLAKPFLSWAEQALVACLRELSSNPAGIPDELYFRNAGVDDTDTFFIVYGDASINGIGVRGLRRTRSSRQVREYAAFDNVDASPADRFGRLVAKYDFGRDERKIAQPIGGDYFIEWFGDPRADERSPQWRDSSGVADIEMVTKSFVRTFSLKRYVHRVDANPLTLHVYDARYPDDMTRVQIDTTALIRGVGDWPDGELLSSERGLSPVWKSIEDNLLEALNGTERGQSALVLSDRLDFNPVPSASPTNDRPPLIENGKWVMTSLEGDRGPVDRGW